MVSSRLSTRQRGHKPGGENRKIFTGAFCQASLSLPPSCHSLFDFCSASAKAMIIPLAFAQAGRGTGGCTNRAVFVARLASMYRRWELCRCQSFDIQLTDEEGFLLAILDSCPITQKNNRFGQAELFISSFNILCNEYRSDQRRSMTYNFLRFVSIKQWKYVSPDETRRSSLLWRRPLRSQDEFRSNGQHSFKRPSQLYVSAGKLLTP